MGVVLITGAAGGLGRALAYAFRSAGWYVAAGVHETDFADPPDAVQPIRLDVNQEPSCRSAVEETLRLWGRLDCLINNAGVTKDQLSSRLTEQDWDQVLSVNLEGAMRCTRAVLPPMIRRRGGHIINISSFAARQGPGGQAAYAAAKAGLLGLTQALAKEVGNRNVQVNAVLPGVLSTSMTDRLPPSRLDELAKANALGRLNSLDEVAAFIVFLSRMRDVSGQVFQLDSRVARWT
jgi:3-oxoacyl-[acyl-carrier protein] reductase